MDRDSEAETLRQMYQAAENYERLRDVVFKVGVALSLAVTMTSLARGIDYTFRPPRTTESLLYVEVFGFFGWGVLYLCASVAIFLASLAGLVWSRNGWKFLFVAHGFHIFISVGLCVALAQGSFSVGGDYRAVAIIIASIVSSTCRLALLNVEKT